LTNLYSTLLAISIEDRLVGIRIKLQYTPENRRYSNFDLLVTLNAKSKCRAFDYLTHDMDIMYLKY